MGDRRATVARPSYRKVGSMKMKVKRVLYAVATIGAAVAASGAGFKWG